MKQVIKIPQTGLGTKEILLEDRGQQIILFDNALMFISSGKWDLAKDDDTAIREKKYFDNTYILDRNDFLPMEMYYHNESRRYILEVGKITIAFGDNEEHPSEARKRCKELFDKITKWKYGIEL